MLTVNIIHVTCRELIERFINSVTIIVEWINGSTGEIIKSSVLNPKLDTTVHNVNGTAFIGSKNIASTVTQNSEPSEIKDYS